MSSIEIRRSHEDHFGFDQANGSAPLSWSRLTKTNMLVEASGIVSSWFKAAE